MKGIIKFSKLLIIPLILIVVSDCNKEASVEQYTGNFRFNVKLSRYDYFYLKTVIDTALTYDGRVYAYQSGDYLRDMISSTSSDNHSDHRLTINFDYGKTVTPVISEKGIFSTDENSGKSSCSGYFSNLDVVFFEVWIEFGHWYLDRYTVTGQRIR